MSAAAAPGRPKQGTAPSGGSEAHAVASVGASVNWPAVQARLAAAQQRLDEVFAPTPAQRQAVLAERAQRLAQAPMALPGATAEVLAFSLAGEQYAIESLWVREVVALQHLTPLPGAPSFVRGIIHLQGAVLSVLDLRALFGMPEPGWSGPGQVVVLDDGSMQFGLLVDQVQGMEPLALDQLQAPLPTLAGVRADYLIGVTRGLQAVLDGRRLLSDPRIVVDQDISVQGV